MQAIDKRLVFVVNSAAFFVSHRLPIGAAALDNGWQVSLVAGRGGSPTMEAEMDQVLGAAGIPCVPVRFGTSSLNPFSEFVGLCEVLRALRLLRPAVVHTASPKALIYGGIAARLLGVPRLVVAISGRGSLFTGSVGYRLQILRKVYLLLLKYVLGHPDIQAIVQNQDDYQWLADSGMIPLDRILLTAGSGVALNDYLDIDVARSDDVVILPARLLKDKGVYEFVEAACILRSKGCSWRFALVGAADYKNPSAVPLREIESWVEKGLVEWWGYRKDMGNVFASSGIVCLPSYREGMPKSLLEAAAAARPVVTTDVTGCREAILPNQTGILVRPRDAGSLAEGLSILIDDATLRRAYGLAGRALALRKFGIESVVDATLAVYDGKSSSIFS